MPENPAASSTPLLPRLIPRLGVAARILWPAGLVLVVFLSVGRFGFNPTDEGLIQAQALRILHGEIPHLDIVSPRPLGSAVLHTFDILLPTPLMATSRAIALAEVMGFSLALGALTFRRSPLRWSVGQCAGVAAAFLINVHTFPITAWHTIDGLLFASVGFAALARGQRRRSQRWISAGMLALGVAALTKQSFFAAPVIGLLWVAWSDVRGERGRLGISTWLAVLFAAIPGAIYVSIVLVGGGLGEMLHQLTAGESVIGESLLTTFAGETDARTLLAHLALLVVLLSALSLADQFARVEESNRNRSLAATASIAIRICLVALVVRVALHQELVLLGTWGMTLLWFLLAVILWLGITSRRFATIRDGYAVLVALLGWMAMLSWGYAVPNLVAGSIALTIINVIWRNVSYPAWLRGQRLAIAATGFSALILIVVGVTLRDARREYVYRDQPAVALTSDLGQVDEAFRGIRTNPTTARYVADAKRCINRFPASRVAIVPDNAMFYAAFDLVNPFPSDWMIDGELVAPESVYLSTARQLSREGDFLMLFETTPAYALYYEPLPKSVDPNTPAFEYTPLVTAVRGRLRGEQIHCGSFVGIYAAPT